MSVIKIIVRPLLRTRSEALQILSDISGDSFTDECFEWPLTKTKMGYGVICFEGYPHYVHRLSHEKYKGIIPAGQVCRHKCDNPPCFNPKHLLYGTKKDNAADMVSRGRHRNKVFPGSKNGFARLTETEVLEIRQLWADGLTLEFIGSLYGVGPTTIYYTCKLGWKHLCRS